MSYVPASVVLVVPLETLTRWSLWAAVVGVLVTSVGVAGAWIGLGVLIRQTDLSRVAAEAAKASADAAIAADRAWVIAELIPICVQFGRDWHRPAGSGWASLSTEEVVGGVHLRHKLKFTNMGRTPAHVLRYHIGYSREVDATGAGLRLIEAGKRPEIEFDRLLGGNDSVEVRDIDVFQYVRDSIEAVGDSEATGILSGWVEYLHVFSDTKVVKVPFVYLYTPETMRLTRVPLQEQKGK
jgi:hypothetical protein